ncbi:uncharacterized protein N0V89_002969 [Didymosphaeria variabile]|uniref:BCAS3 domain-containing protein n=1 Tax=Didymosphaeria variabile TaxID=1932322 RepID=A0A9W9CEW4_9PLEO|nr:uncharacterized protein N0V89_002969 [Didymosphaeria variabile]KAJ4358387.1 hypothetical protein N0V89_002969 [Didymosphaeria variabile]
MYPGYCLLERTLTPSHRAKSPPSAKRFSSASPTGPSYNATTSPLLSALGATTKSAAQYTNEWTKSLPFFANQASPSNGGIPIHGSPPQFHNSPNVRGGVYGQAAASPSPPVVGMNPRSTPDHYTSFGGRLRESPQESPARDPRNRRASMFSHHGGRPTSQQFAANPPLPHQPQTHYYNLPDFDLGLNNATPEGIAAGEEGYFCGFDTLGMAADEAARTAENVLLVGYQGGLDVFRVEKGKMDVLGRLEGLRGGVVGAKILPWTSRRDPLSAVRPLIVLTIHGPVLGDNRSSSGSDVPSVIDDGSSDSPSRPGSPHGKDATSRITSYQTTVEVYSLKEKCKIAVLYQSPFVSVTSPFDSPIFQPPPPVGDFSVDAKGKFVTVSSGASGEVFVFAPYSTLSEDYQESFRCIGKVWTTVQPRERVNHSSASSAADGSHEDIPPEIYGVPVVSLSERWLVFTPPASTAHFPVNGVPSTSAQYERPPGLAHHTVPPQPSVNCAVDAPEVASLINRLTKEGTQVAIKGARWAAEKGFQAYKNYMNKGTQPNGANVYGADPPQQYFPPTHGHNQAPRQEATVISVVDLQRLHDAEENKSKMALNPIATFPATLGCSHLSFSPGGLMLMTINKKGDVYEVWDLKRLNFRRARKTTREQATGQHVRQVARFSRMTVSNVVDVVWSAPRIDKVAVITDKGTVHMFLMPASAFQWPPPRRTRKPNDPTAPNDEAIEAGRGSTVNSAMQAFNGTAKPFLDAIRPGSNSNGSRFTFKTLGMTPAAGAKSGKAVAAGVGKQINTIRHAGDNKLALPSSSSGVKAHSVRWLTGKGRGHIALVAGGVLQIHRVQMRPATGKGKSANENSVSKKKISEFGLLPIRDSVLAPSITAQLYAQSDEPEHLQDIHGEWIPRALPARKGRAGSTTKHFGLTPAPLSFSEIETNPPYQPFYTDRRVTRFIFTQLPADAQVSSSEYQTPELVSNLHHENDETPWLFGEDIEAIRVSSPVTQHFDSGDEDAIAGVTARIENKLIRRDGEDEIEQVIVTTRRRRTRRDGAEEEEEGFFEDDCEVLDFAEDRV